MGPALICIAGGSASGKSTVARALLESLKEYSCAAMSLDHFFRDWNGEHDLRTANRPEAVLWPAFHDCLDVITAGGMADLPVPGTRAAWRGAASWAVGARDVVIVEGLFALWDEQLRDRTDLAIYVDAPDDERLLRRLSRDIVERGATVDSTVTWFRYDVAPHFPLYTAPGRWRADLVVPNVDGQGPTPTGIAAVAAAIRAIVASKSTARPADNAS